MSGSCTETEDEPATMGALLAEAEQRGRKLALAELDAAIETARREERERSAERETEINAEWSDRSAERLAAGFDKLKHDLACQIGKELCRVLQPFLDEAVCRRAEEQLLALLDEELATSRDVVLEVRAPEVLHERLGQLLHKKNIAVAITQSEELELVMRDGASRFENMAARWMNALRAPAA
jgi:hypothetical protein